MLTPSRSPLIILLFVATLTACDDSVVLSGGQGEPCASDSDCRNTFFCDPSTNTCQPVGSVSTLDTSTSDQGGGDTGGPDTLGSDTTPPDVTGGDCAPGDTRTCGTDVGECESALQECIDGTWGPCNDTGPTDEICDGLDNDCDGSEDEQLSVECGTSLGLCEKGAQSCIGVDDNGEALWGPCKGGILPDDELCGDGLDNDCDGTPDNGPDCECQNGTTQPCGTDVGECERGEQTCTDGRWGACVGEVAKTDEICDGLDNDCDTVVDDNISEICDINGCTGSRFCIVDGNGEWTDCSADSIAQETCDGINNDCDDRLDEGVTEACTVNGCAGTRICVEDGPGSWGSCQPNSVSSEVCDGDDNDCDGVVDQGVTRTCVINGCPGTEACVEEGPGTWGACQPNSVSPETCDGTDQDCDGKIDQGVTRACVVNGCAGTETCVEEGSGTWNACQPNSAANETCDGTDEDCDGKIDQGVTRACVINGCAGTETCVEEGSGTWNTCVANNPIAEVCDGNDNNCNGTTDEDVTQNCTLNNCPGTQTCVVDGNGTWNACQISVTLDDGVACTDDACDGGGNVIHTPNDANCGAGEYCDPSLDCQTSSTVFEITSSINTDNGRIDGVLSPGWQGSGRFELSGAVRIPAGNTVTVTGSNTLELVVAGPVELLGTLDLSGNTGTSTNCSVFGPPSGPAGGGGGGGQGGGGGNCNTSGGTQPTAGSGTGTSPGVGGGDGGANAGGGGGAGHASTGVDGLPTPAGGSGGASWGSDTAVNPGAGGGGGACGAVGSSLLGVFTPGAAGGSGGGAALIESSTTTLTLSGTVTAEGGDGGWAPTCSGIFGDLATGGGGGGGAGGTLRLRAATQVVVQSGATLNATGGQGDGTSPCFGGNGSDGRIRLEDSDGSVSTAGASVSPTATVGTY